MRCLKKCAAAFMILSLLFLTSCASLGRLSLGESVLKVGTQGVTGDYNPFYSEYDLVMAQQFEAVQRPGAANRLENACGSITYEYLDGGKVKYTVSIVDNIRFSDGTYATIDDVIFYYYVLADATYDGVYSDWHLNDIEGINEFYYDDKDYAASLEAIEEDVGDSYTLESISPEDYEKYLTETMLDGKFDGNAQGASPSGGTWEEYCGKLGYSEEYAALGKSVDADELLRLLSRIEVEQHYNSYDPEAWWRDRLVDEYIAENYSDGIDVTSISGISKVNGNTCTVIFNSVNFNSISQINPLLVPKSVYGVGYVKGTAQIIKDNAAAPVGSGPYAFERYNESGGYVALAANEYYRAGEAGFDSLRFIDLAARGLDEVSAVVDGSVDVVELEATEEIVNTLTKAEVRCNLSDCDYYNSVCFNADTVDIDLRRGLMCLANWTGEAKSRIGSYYTAVYRPLSIKFGEYPSAVSEPYFKPDTEAANEYFEKAGYTQQDKKMVNADGKQLVLEAYYCGGEDEVLFSIMQSYQTALNADGIVLNLNNVTEEEYYSAIEADSADLWFGRVYDGKTGDKYDYYYTGARLNDTGISAKSLNTRLDTIRATTDYASRTAMTEEMLDYVMLLAVELPLYQQKRVTAYNTDSIADSSVTYDADPQGCRYTLHTLVPA